MRIGALFFLVWTQSCAGAHTDEDAAGSGAAGAVAMAGAAAGGKGGGGAKPCDREPAQHRASAMMCDSERSMSPMPQTSLGSFSCKVDADCTMGQNGRCTDLGRSTWYCTYDECFADADCKSGPCICGEGGYAENSCMAGNCQTDADCGANGYCSPTFGACGGYSGVEAYYCHTCEDECVDNEDCVGQPGADCRFEPSVGHWRCGTSSCVG
ncbi:MAG TPA: hypothetical protein VJR89_38530 [Polyangiales bacterium]|nr:hypothetical protein [Polyangiales bacterium]